MVQCSSKLHMHVMPEFTLLSKAIFVKPFINTFNTEDLKLYYICCDPFPQAGLHISVKYHIRKSGN